MNPDKLIKLLFFTLVVSQFQAKGQDMVITPGTVNVYNNTTVTVNGNLILQDKSGANISTMTVSGGQLIVSGGVYLGTESVLYLRNGAQLIQNDITNPNYDPRYDPMSPSYDPGYVGTHPDPTGTKGLETYPVANTGTGVLSIYQEGLADVHQFNYWCSPVGATGGSGNGNFGISMLKRPTDTTPFYEDILPVDAPKYNGKAIGSTGKLEVASYWINTYNGSTLYKDWHSEGSGTTIAPGSGFTMKGTGGATDTDPSYVPVNDPMIPVGETTGNNPDGKHQRYDFRGRPNTGDITAPVADGQLTLIGNPYPSAVDLNAFFSDGSAFVLGNTNTDGFAYFWEQGQTDSHYLSSYTGGYGVYVPLTNTTPPNGDVPADDPNAIPIFESGIYVPATFYKFRPDGTYDPTTATGVANPGNPDRRYLPIGQGFMVLGNFTNDSTPYVVMKNSFRVYKAEKAGTAPGGAGVGTGSVFSKKTNTVDNRPPQIRFSTTYDAGSVGEMVQVFNPNSTPKIDRGKDAENPNDYPVVVNLLVDNKGCVISTTPFDMDMKIPLVFNSQKQAKYKITVKEMINVDQISNVYLHDKIANVYYDIKNDFASLTLPGGENKDQYEVTFEAKALGVADVTAKSFDIFQNNEAKKLIVSNPLQKELVSCDLYDISGRLVFGQKKLGVQSSYEFSTAGLSDGVYIVKVASQDNKIKSQKVIIRR